MNSQIAKRTRQIILLFLLLSCLNTIHAQEVKTVDVPEPGTLSTVLTMDEKYKITNLVITGTIDARDFRTMRDQIPNLAVIDLKDASIVSYEGNEGPDWYINSHPENRIPAYAFSKRDYNSGKTSLTSFIYPKSATSIGEFAFSYCKGLTSIVIPSSIDSIGNDVFKNCINLSSVTFADSLRYIGKSAFANCGLLSSISIPSSVISIGASAFANCIALTTVTILGSETDLGSSAFANCELLNKVSLSEGITNIGAGAFSACKNLVSITIPSTVDSIGRRAFWNCEKLTSLNISPGVKSIGVETFAYCRLLPKVLIPSTVKTIGNNSFIDCGKLRTVTIEEGVSSIGDLAFYQTYLYSITIPASVKSIGRSAFQDCLSLYYITLNEGLESIGESAFSGCFNIKTVTIPSTVANFGNSAFYNCSKLETAIIPEGVTKIGGYAFAGCLNFGTVTIPSTLTSIGNYAFSNCTKLTSFNIPEKLDYLGEGAFFGCVLLKNITLPAAMTTIPKSLFNYCSSLSSINIPASVTSIEAEAFSGCISLTSLTIPSSVTSIGTSAFYNCNGLTNITIPSSIKTIGNFAFNLCSKLSTVNIPHGTTTIGNAAFSECYKLTSVIIPSSVTSLGIGSFYNCYDLQSVTVKHGTPLQLPSNQDDFFGVNKNTCKLYVPFGSRNLYLTSNQWQDFTNIYESPSYFKLSESVLLGAEEGSKMTVEIVSETSWVVSINEPWLSINPTSGIGNGTIEIVATANPSLIPRKASISITLDNSDSQSNTITQEAKPVGIEDIQPGMLSELLTEEEKSTLTRLVLSGTIDARDFKTMRDEIPNLSVVDVSNVSIASYAGIEGTVNWKTYDYPENQIPPYSFNNPNTNREKGNLTTFIYPFSVNSIGENAFRYCVGLTSALIPASVDSIGESAFSNCIKLNSVTLSEGIVFIGDYAFARCTGLTTINIPSSVNSIKENAFWETTLNSIRAGHSIPLNLYNTPGLFMHVNKSTCKLNVPNGTKDLYASAFVWKDFKNISESSTPFLLSANSIYLSGDSIQSDSIHISTDLSWTAESNQPWLQLNSTSGTGTGNLIMTATANPLYALRTAKVIITTDTNISQTVLVTQEAKSIFLNATPGCLASLLTDSLKNALSLSLTDTIDARDFKILRDRLPNLRYLDLSKAMIAAYTGNEGTASDTIVYYPANQVPSFAFGGRTVESYGKVSLKSFIFPLTVSSIGDFAFNGCIGLSDIKLPPVDSIGDYTFMNCQNFTTLEIPDGVKYIGQSAFAKCLKLSSLNIAPTVTGIGASAFSDCTSLATVDIPSPVEIVGDNTFYSCTSLKSVTFCEGVKSIGKSAFSNCINLASITIAPSVTSIGDGAFSECTSLTTITIPSNIGNSAFYNCTNLTAVTILEGVKSIGSSAFSNCSNLTSVSLPSTLSELGASSFYYCGNLSAVTIPSAVKRIEADTFYKCDKLSSVIINEGVEFIGPKAFYECRSIRSIIIPSSVEYLGNYAFRGCQYLSNVILKEGLKMMGSWAFLNCTSLNSITLPGTLTYMDIYAFSGCTALSSVVITEGATKIGPSAFTNCSSLKSVTIASTVQLIGQYAFNTSGILSVKTYASNPKDIILDPGVFTLVNKTRCTLYVPFGSKSLYAMAPQWKDFFNIQEFGGPVVYPKIVVDKGSVDKVIDLKAAFRETNIINYSIYSINNQEVVNAFITGSTLTLEFSKENTGISEIIVTGTLNGRETSLTLNVEVKIPTSVSTFEKKDIISIYPNPTKGDVKLKINGSPVIGMKYFVYDTKGRVIYQSVIKNEEEVFDLNGNSPGIYFIKIEKRMNESYKIILE